MDKNKNLTLIIILIFAVILRFYKMEENMLFTGEVGHNYLAVKNLIAEKEIPLLGPPTSHPWLYFGPLFYWLIAPVLIIGDWNPVNVSYFFAGLFTFGIILNFKIVEKIFNTRTALISSVFIAISPTWLQMTRGSRFFSLSTLAFYPFFYFFYRSVTAGKLKDFFWTGIFYGVMLNFHLSGLILIPPVALYVYLRRNKINIKRIVYGAAGFAIANLPFIVYNAQNKFEMLTKLVLWVPYRLAGFVGLYPKNTADSEIVSSNIQSLYKFISGMFAGEVALTGAIVFILFGFGMYHLFNRNYIRKNVGVQTLIVILVLGYLAIFFHGDPPRHYYMPLYPVLIVLVAYFIDKTIEAKRLFGYLIVGIIIAAGTISIHEDSWLDNSSGLIESRLVTYDEQVKISEAIVNDAEGKTFTLRRVGGGDEFEGDFAQNYQYLMWRMGNEPVSVGLSVVGEDLGEVAYTIYEYPDDKLETAELAYESENVKIVRSEE